jgi:phenylalanyl-tRNA synthetase alpha chain
MQVPEQVLNAVSEVEAAVLLSEVDLERFRLEFLSRNGVIQGLMGLMKQATAADRPLLGQQLNQLKQRAEGRYNEAKEALERAMAAKARNAPGPDLTRPPMQGTQGSRHILRSERDAMLAIFRQLGFSLAEGPEIEDDWHNFSALNFPVGHPAREMQDTFFVHKATTEAEQDYVLRTHTSPVQIRVMEGRKPPIRVLAPGRVYRNEAVSARAHCLFHQIEGLYIDTDVSFADLKATLYYFIEAYYGKGVKIRYRPSYFPFTEPSAEVDISCLICGGSGCNVCKHTGWVEIAGSGMVHPNVLKAAGLDPAVYRGFAFGMGIERAVMLRYQINDLRLFTENDVRFLGQFAHI